MQVPVLRRHANHKLGGRTSRPAAWAGLAWPFNGNDTILDAFVAHATKVLELFITHGSRRLRIDSKAALVYYRLWPANHSEKRSTSSVSGHRQGYGLNDQPLQSPHLISDEDFAPRRSLEGTDADKCRTQTRRIQPRLEGRVVFLSGVNQSGSSWPQAMQYSVPAGRSGTARCRRRPLELRPTMGRS